MICILRIPLLNAQLENVVEPPPTRDYLHVGAEVEVPTSVGGAILKYDPEVKAFDNVN